MKNMDEKRNRKTNPLVDLMMVMVGQEEPHLAWKLRLDEDRNKKENEQSSRRRFNHAGK
jgi:hypothetical protein